MLKNATTEAKFEMKRLFSMSGQREALPDSGSHYLFNSLIEAQPAARRARTVSLMAWASDVRSKSPKVLSKRESSSTNGAVHW